MKAVLETITPKKAAELLKKNTHNRPCMMSYVDELSAAILRGEWKVNGDTIKLNGDVLVDGQHRLHAVVKSGKSIVTYIVRGVQADAFNTIDLGRKRTTGQLLARDGFKHYNTLSAAARTIYMYETGRMRILSSRVGDFSPSVAFGVVESHSGLVDSVDFVLSVGAHSIAPGGSIAAFHWLMKQKDDVLADTFWTQVCTGEHIGAKDPSFILRRRLIDNRKSQAKLRGYVLAALFVKAWNATRAGKAIGTLKFMDDESFPEVQ